MLHVEAKRMRELYARLVDISPEEVDLANVLRDMEDQLDSE
jgi:hypothetical protein